MPANCNLSIYSIHSFIFWLQPYHLKLLTSPFPSPSKLSRKSKGLGGWIFKAALPGLPLLPLSVKYCQIAYLSSISRRRKCPELRSALNCPNPHLWFRQQTNKTSNIILNIFIRVIGEYKHGVSIDPWLDLVHPHSCHHSSVILWITRTWKSQKHVV